jgi:hypothetical protein
MLIRPGLHVRVFPLHDATQRTQNRVRERGRSGFIVREQRSSVVALGNIPGILLMSVSDSEQGRDPWLGWLPMCDIDVQLWED